MPYREEYKPMNTRSPRRINACTFILGEVGQSNMERVFFKFLFGEYHSMNVILFDSSFAYCCTGQPASHCSAQAGDGSLRRAVSFSRRNTQALLPAAHFYIDEGRDCELSSGWSCAPTQTVGRLVELKWEPCSLGRQNPLLSYQLKPRMRCY